MFSCIRRLSRKTKSQDRALRPKVKGDIEQITKLVEAMEKAERPVFYTGGGVINSGPAAASCCANWSMQRVSQSHPLDGPWLLSCVWEKLVGYVGHARPL